MEVQVALFRNARGPIAKAIHWQTDSPYSHAALLFDGEFLIESEGWKGVHASTLIPSKDVDVFDVVGGVSQEEAEAIWTFAQAQLGKGYDYWGVARFISRTRLPENDRWFCSELVYAAFQAAGIELLARVEPWQVSPGTLSWSPLLQQEGEG